MIKLIEILNKLKSIIIPLILSVVLFMLGKKSEQLKNEKAKSKLKDKYESIDSLKVNKSDIFKSEKW